MGIVTDVKVAANGRMVIPHSIRRAMGLKGETRLIMTVEGDEVRLSTVNQALAEAQRIYRENAKGRITVDGFLEERKAEAKQDNEKY